MNSDNPLSPPTRWSSAGGRHEFLPPQPTSQLGRRGGSHGDIDVHRALSPAWHQRWQHLPRFSIPTEHTPERATLPGPSLLPQDHPGCARARGLACPGQAGPLGPGERSASASVGRGPQVASGMASGHLLTGDPQESLSWPPAGPGSHCPGGQAPLWAGRQGMLGPYTDHRNPHAPRKPWAASQFGPSVAWVTWGPGLFHGAGAAV